MSTYPPVSTQVIGQTEKALNAILNRLLSGTGVTEPQWVTLVLAASGGEPGGEPVSHDEFAGRVAGVLHISAADARDRIGELAAARLLRAENGAPVQLTEAGRQLVSRIRGQVGQITQRLWGDLPPEDLQIAGRVLGIITARANAELAAG